MNIKLVRLKGKNILPYIDDLAHLRIEIFKDYPYLYLGGLEYEQQYLYTYVSCNESIMVIAFYNGKIIGASTAIPLIFESNEFKQPFLMNHAEIKNIFYLGESVLLPIYRGKHIYRQFFYERHLAAREYGCNTVAFCAVERSPFDPRRPVNYQPLDPVWQHFNYAKHPELSTYYEWKEIGEPAQSPKPMTFWLKSL